jgi:hypothetical protein
VTGHNTRPQHRRLLRSSTHNPAPSSVRPGSAPRPPLVLVSEAAPLSSARRCLPASLTSDATVMMEQKRDVKPQFITLNVLDQQDRRVFHSVRTTDRLQALMDKYVLHPGGLRGHLRHWHLPVRRRHPGVSSADGRRRQTWSWKTGTRSISSRPLSVAVWATMLMPDPRVCIGHMMGSRYVTNLTATKCSSTIGYL